ncbi:MAG TPA: PTS sugar transporter subunit IIA [Spirochaetota bacterium]|nr:PTS sugar transporter subunit IIA [Spirochaetota bacterium]
MPLNLFDILDRALMTRLKAVTKREAIDELVELLRLNNNISDKTKILPKLWERENIMSTGIGMGVGIPHIRLATVDRPLISIGIQPQAVKDYLSIDEQPVRIIIIIICPENQELLHTQILAQLINVLKSDDVINKLLQADNSQEIYNIFTANI